MGFKPKRSFADDFKGKRMQHEGTAPKAEPGRRSGKFCIQEKARACSHPGSVKNQQQLGFHGSPNKELHVTYRHTYSKQKMARKAKVSGTFSLKWKERIKKVGFN